jgi:hypothetical protein
VDNAALGQVFSDYFSSTYIIQGRNVTFWFRSLQRHCYCSSQQELLTNHCRKVTVFAAALLLFLTTGIANKSLQEDYCLLMLAFRRVEPYQTMRRHFPATRIYYFTWSRSCGCFSGLEYLHLPVEEGYSWGQVRVVHFTAVLTAISQGLLRTPNEELRASSAGVNKHQRAFTIKTAFFGNLPWNDASFLVKILFRFI